MEQEAKVIINVLSDNPVSKDAFGPHQKIATAIVDLISQEDEGKAIALTGSWGSGKSSVVKMLQDRAIKTKADIAVFSYNAWAHQGDPVRRSFMEQLIDACFSLGLMAKSDRDYWDDKKKELARKLERSTIKSHTAISTYAAIIAISVLFTPVGLAIGGFSDWPSWTRWLAIGIAVLPVFFFVALFLHWCATGKKKRVRFLSMLVDRGRQTVHSTASRTPDPTSIEFRHLYAELMEKALANKKLRLLIVVDNLDRVETEDALVIWSTVKTFFEPECYEVNDWYKQVWLLVPFDPSGIRALWNESPDDCKTVDNPKPRSMIEIDKAHPANSFIDKTFQVRFEVPLPILSDWPSFFDDQLGKALEGWRNGSELSRIRTVYRLIGTPRDVPPTPRDIKLFINGLSTTYRIHGSSIPLHIQALYTILRSRRLWDTTDQVLTDISSDSLSKYHSSITRVIDADYRALLAALHFGVDRDKGRQIVLQKPLQDAMQGKNLEGLRNRLMVPGFDEVCARVLLESSGDWSSAQPDILAWVAYALTELESPDREGSDSVWQILGDSIVRIQEWSRLGANEFHGLSSVLRRQPTERTAFQLASSLSVSKKLYVETDGSTDAEESVAVPEGMEVFFETLQDLDLLETAKDRFTVPLNPTDYFEVLQALVQDPELELTSLHFCPSCKGNALVSHIASLIGLGEFNSDSLIAVKLLREFELAAEWSWAPVVESAGKRLEASNSPTGDEFSALVTLLRSLESSVPAEGSQLASLTLNGHVLHHIYTFGPAEDDSALSQCMALMIQFFPKAEIKSHIGNSAHGHSVYIGLLREYKEDDADRRLISLTTDLVRESISAEQLFALRGIDGKKSFLYAILRQLQNTGKLRPYMSSNLVALHPYTLKAALGDDTYREILGDFIANDTLLEEICRVAFGESYIVQLVNVYKSVAPPPRQLNDYVTKGLLATGKDDWIEDIALYEDNKWSKIDLLVALSDSNVAVELGVHFADAIRDYKDKLLKSHQPVKKVITHWDVIFSSLKESTRKTVVREVAKDVATTDKSCSSVLDVFGDSLIDCGVLKSIADDIFHSFTTFVESQDERRLRWLAEVLEGCPKLDCNKDIYQTFVERVEGCYDNDEMVEEIIDLVTRIAKARGIKVPKKKASEDPESAGTE